jgi:hypothetical protein
MRAVLAALFAACSCAAFFCTPLRADYSYERHIQITAGELYDALRAQQPPPRKPGSREPVGAANVTTTNLIKGNRMALIAKGHTTVIDIAAETITEIEFSKKTYSVLPFSQMKKLLEDAAARDPDEASFNVTVQRPGQTKTVGILNASETILSLAGASGGQNIIVDSWIGTVPGYEQMIDFNRRLAAKMGDAFASGMALLALSAPQTLQGFGEAAKELNKLTGAPFQTTIKITGASGILAEASIHLDNFGGGSQDVTKFDPPAGFKKVDAVLPALPK